MRFLKELLEKRFSYPRDLFDNNYHPHTMHAIIQNRIFSPDATMTAKYCEQLNHDVQNAESPNSACLNLKQTEMENDVHVG